MVLVCATENYNSAFYLLASAIPFAHLCILDPRVLQLGSFIKRYSCDVHIGSFPAV